MKRLEFYDKYKAVIEQRHIDGTELYHKACAIVVADSLLDDEVGNNKALNIDDFFFTIVQDKPLKDIFKCKAAKSLAVRAKDMYDVQLYRLLLDSLLLVMQMDNDNTIELYGLLSPSAKEVVTVLGISKKGLPHVVDYATTEDCENCLAQLLQEEVNEQGNFAKILDETQKVVADTAIKDTCRELLAKKDEITDRVLLENSIKSFSDMLLKRIEKEYQANKVRCSYALSEMTPVGVLSADNVVMIKNELCKNINVICLNISLSLIFDMNKMCEYKDFINLISNLILCDTLTKPDLKGIEELL